MSPKTTPMLPSVNAQKPVVTDPSGVSADGALTAISLENALSVDLIRFGYRCFCRACQPIDMRYRYCRAALAASIIHGNMVMNYGFRSGGSGGVFPHQRNGDAAVCRQRRIVGKQRLGIGLARDREDMGRRQPFPLQDLANRIGAIGGKIECAIVALRRHEARRGMTDDRDAQRRRLKRSRRVSRSAGGCAHTALWIRRQTSSGHPGQRSPG